MNETERQIKALDEARHEALRNRNYALADKLSRQADQLLRQH